MEPWQLGDESGVKKAELGSLTLGGLPSSGGALARLTGVKRGRLANFFFSVA